MATLAVARREMNSWRWTAFMFTYLFALAYVAAGLTYWTAVWAGL
jgi:ferrous iron transport protein B